jgi:hypothetical protein
MTTLPPWFDALRLDDLQACKKVVLREVRLLWRALHPNRPRSGPVTLRQELVYTATATVLKALTPRQRKTLKWGKLIAQVRALVKEHQTGKKQRGDPYSVATVRKHVRCFIYMNLRVNEIPPALLDARQPWMKGCDKTLVALDTALHEWKSGRPFAEAGYARFEDYYLPDREFEASYVPLRATKRSK